MSAHLPSVTTEAEGHTYQVRPPEVVMTSQDMLGSRANRHSFIRSMLRRAVANKWQITREHFDIDGAGVGDAIYRADVEGRVFRLVVFSAEIDESERTDRVIAQRWDVTIALVEGEVPTERLNLLREQVPRQEKGRADDRTLIWARANRSGRFFNYVADQLAAGKQPERDYFGHSPYLIRSTAFYSNGRFNLVPYERFTADHPLNVPYRPHMLAAWLLRQFSLDMVEHVAAARNPEGAATLSPAWKRYFGVGNATGLGLIPYAMNHPLIMEAWARAREVSLAAVRERTVNPAQLTDSEQAEISLVRTLMDQAITYFTDRNSHPGEPFCDDALITRQLKEMRDIFDNLISSADGAAPFALWDKFYLEAEKIGSEAAGLAASFLIELSGDLDHVIDELLKVDEVYPLNPEMTVAELREILAEKFSWALDIDFTDEHENYYAWYLSTNNEEPRRIPRTEVQRPNSELPVDVAAQIKALAQELEVQNQDCKMGKFVLNHPALRYWVTRIQRMAGTTYGELQDNALSKDFLPLALQRFQLAMYGMANFNPKSTDWLRVTLLSGAPTTADVNVGPENEWLFVTPPDGPQDTHE